MYRRYDRGCAKSSLCFWVWQQQSSRRNKPFLYILEALGAFYEKKYGTVKVRTLQGQIEWRLP